MSSVRIFNRVSIDASTTIEVITFYITSTDGKIGQASYPPGYFTVRSEPLASPSSSHGWIKIQAVNGSRKMKFDSSEILTYDGSTMANQKEVLDYLNGFFFKRPGSQDIAAFQTQIDSGGLGGAAFATDVAKANDNISTLSIIMSEITPTTEAGDGNGPYVTGFDELIKGNPVVTNNVDHASGDGFKVSAAGNSLVKVGSGTSQVKISTGKATSTDKLFAPRRQPYWFFIITRHEGTPSPDLAKGFAGKAFGAKREPNFVLKLNEGRMLDNATWMIEYDNESVSFQDELGGGSWVVGDLYFQFFGRHASGSVVGAIGKILDIETDLSNLGVKSISGHKSNMENASFTEWVIEMDEGGELFELRTGVGAWDMNLITDLYRYAHETYRDSI